MLPAILQTTECVMSTDKENNKLEDMKVDEKVDAKEDVKKSEENDVGKKNDKEVKEAKDVKSEGDAEPEKKDDKEKVTTASAKKPAAKAKVEKKKVEKSEEEEEEEEEDEEEDDEEEDGKVEKDGKGVPLLDQPLQVSGARQRKGVDRLSIKADVKESAPLEIPEGKGVSLGSIAVIEYNITKHKGDDLKKFHQLLFGRGAKSLFIKKNIRKFNGFDFDADSEQYEKKKAAAQKLEVKGLKEIAAVLSLTKTGTRDELAVRILDFLLEPEAPSGAKVKGASKAPALTKAGRPKRSAAARAKGYSESDDEDSDGGKRAPRARRSKGKRPNLKDESSSEDERKKRERDDEDEEGEGSDESAVATPTSGDESDEDKSKKKRTPVKPAPKPAPKKAAPPPKKAVEKKKAEKKPVKRKQDSEEEEEEGESSEDEPLIKKTKSPPTDEEIKTYVKEILEGADLEEITMKTVCKQVYSHYPDFDLAHKKDFIKTTVKSLIST